MTWQLDLRTLSIVFCAVELTLALTILAFWWSDRRYREMALLGGAYVSYAVVHFSFGFRGMIPEAVGVAVFNLFTAAGGLLLVHAMSVFCRRRHHFHGQLALTTAFAAGIYYFTDWAPDAAGRIIVQSAFGLGIGLLVMGALWGHRVWVVRGPRAVLLLAVGTTVVLSAARISMVLTGPHIDNVLQQGFAVAVNQLVTVMAYTMVACAMIWGVFAQTSADMRRSHASLLLAQRVGRTGSVEIDLANGSIEWSPETYVLFGIDPKRKPLERDQFIELADPRDRSTLRRVIYPERRDTVSPPVEYRFTDPQGRLRWMYRQSEVLKDSQGRPIRRIITHQDITERRLMEDELRRSRDKMAEVLAAMNIAGSAMIMSDIEQRIVYVNDSAIEILGLPAEPGALAGKTLDDFQTHNNDYIAVAAVARAALAVTDHWEGTMPWHRVADDKSMFLDVRTHRLPNGGWVAVAVDATVRINLEEEERRHREREAQAGKIEALGNLAGGIAHDFNNLLGAVLGFGQFLLQDLPPGSDQRRFAERIVSTSERGRSLVRQILAFSRRTVIEKTNLMLRDPIIETKEMLRATLPTTTEIFIENGMPDAMVFADKGQLVQVLVNLCVNGSDALDGKPGSLTIMVAEPNRERADLLHLPVVTERPSPGGVETWHDPDGTGHIVSGGVPKHSCVSLSVTDTGTGIPRAMLNKILEPFVTTKGQGKGTGLGLAVVHRIVLEHGGAMVVTTREGEGTRFEIILPLSSAMDESAQAGDDGDATLVKAAQTGSILVVDDDESYLLMVETALARIGHKVQSAADPTQALQIVQSRERHWDVVVTDQTMPRLRGSDLVRSVKTISPDTKCIICTGFSSGLNETEATNAGADGFMLKPYSVGELSSMVARLLAQKLETSLTSV